MPYKRFQVALGRRFFAMQTPLHLGYTGGRFPKGVETALHACYVKKVRYNLMDEEKRFGLEKERILGPRGKSAMAIMVFA